MADPCIPEHFNAPASRLLCQRSHSFGVFCEHYSFCLYVEVPELRKEALRGFHELLRFNLTSNSMQGTAFLKEEQSTIMALQGYQ